MSKQKLKLFVNYRDLPEKIQSHLKGEIAEGFVAALKTTYKPNATIPILWLIVHSGGLIFCSTHKTRGMFKSFAYSDIDSIKIHTGSQFLSSKVEIIVTDMKEDNFVFTVPSDLDFEHLQNVLKTMNYQTI